VIDAGAGDDTLTVDPGASTALGLHQLIYTAGAGNNSLVLASGSARIDGTASGGNLTTTVGQGAQLTTERLQQNSIALEDNSRLTLLPGNQTSVVTSLALGAGATLDIGNCALVVDYAGASPLGSIRQQILAGRGGSGLGASWNGAGITSSAVAQANQSDPESRSIGFAENAQLPLGPYTTFRGVAVDDTAVLLAFARTADANLDGVVNDNDVTVVGATYAPGAANATWASGDFDFNGFVDDDDVTLLGAFYEPAAVVAGSPDRATVTTAGLPDVAVAVETFGRDIVRGRETRAQQMETRAQRRETRAQQVDRELVDLLAESIAIDGQAPFENLADPQRPLGKRSSAVDRIWARWEAV
jgi:hypothetical protein